MTDAAVAGYDVSQEATLLPLFATPVLVIRMTNPRALIGDLKAAILARRESHPGIERANVGGWHSDAGMMNWGGEAARTLVNQAVAAARRITYLEGQRIEDAPWSVQMWANVSGPGALHAQHTHPGNLWAAVFYVDLGMDGRSFDDVGGELYLEDPRFPEAVMRHTGFRFIGPDGTPQNTHQDLRPREGDLILFPAWLRHGVKPYRGDRERISIAMNLDVPQIGGPR